MDYETAVQLFFQEPDPHALPPPVIEAAPARQLRDAVEPLAAHGIWARETNQRYEQIGLDFLSGYVRGRAASLGDVPAAVVLASFGVFAPTFLRPLYEASLGIVPRAKVLEARTEGTVASLRRILGEADIAKLVHWLWTGLGELDGTARPLFSGLLALDRPDDPLGQLWRACELIREHRGDSHLAVCICAGLGPVEMNILTELYCGMPLGSYTATRGWGSEAIGAAVEGLEEQGIIEGNRLTEAGHQVRHALERQTDQMEQPLVDVLGERLEAVVVLLTDLSKRLIAAQGFPPDPFKRAAG